VQLATLTPGTAQETNPIASSTAARAVKSPPACRSLCLSAARGPTPPTGSWDGNDNNELPPGGIGILSSIDSIQEFKVLTYNYSAEFGFRAGRPVLVTTKSGAISFMARYSNFSANKSLDAKSFFAPLLRSSILTSRRLSRRTYLQEQTFFFLDGRTKVPAAGITFTGLVPTDAQRGAISPVWLV